MGKLRHPPSNAPRDHHVDASNAETSTSEALQPTSPIDDRDVLRITVALSSIDRDGQVAIWWSELRVMHERDGVRPDRALWLAYRRANIALLLSQGITDRRELAKLVGCSERSVRGDIGALRRLIRPRTRFVGQREAA